jgi:hypothetical protein
VQKGSKTSQTRPLTIRGYRRAKTGIIWPDSGHQIKRTRPFKRTTPPSSVKRGRATSTGTDPTPIWPTSQTFPTGSAAVISQTPWSRLTSLSKTPLSTPTISTTLELSQGWKTSRWAGTRWTRSSQSWPHWWGRRNSWTRGSVGRKRRLWAAARSITGTGNYDLIIKFNFITFSLTGCLPLTLNG